MTTGGPRRRRQARGERRIAQILDVAANVFAEVGYDAATTNTIAAAAGVSPGTLYQFFANKEAIAAGLADRFAREMREAHEAAFDPADVERLPLDRLLDRVIDPIVAFSIANPCLEVLLGGTETSQDLAAPVRPLREAVSSRIGALIAVRSPALPAPERARLAQVSMQVFKAMLALIRGAGGAERGAMVAELKRLLHGYLAPVIGS